MFSRFAQSWPCPCNRECAQIDDTMTGRFEAHAERAQITKDIDNEYEAAPLTRCRRPEQRQAGGKNKREEKAAREKQEKGRPASTGRHKNRRRTQYTGDS